MSLAIIQQAKCTQIYILRILHILSVLINNHTLYLRQMSREILDDPSIVQPIFQELKKNFLTGETKSLSFRKSALKRLLEGYVALESEFNEALKKDLGHNEFFCYFGAHALTKAEVQDLINGVSSWIKPQSVPSPLLLGLASCEIQHEPLGVALVISAWNYPIYTAIPQVAAAISAGNCVILKPSELAAQSSGVLKKLFEQYLDPRFFRVIEGKIEVARAVTSLPVDIICFTGSTVTGRLVAIEAAKNLVPCILELGGKCPVVVDETATVDAAVNRILFGKLLNCGQTCIGVDHVYVHESIKDSFRDTLLKKLRQNYEENQNLEEEGNYGKIINKFHVERIEKFLTDNHGGKVIYGGKVIKKQSRFFEPTVIESPNKDSLLMKDEIFGPILPIFYYNNLQEVINEIVSRPKPLVVYHFSQSSKNTKEVREKTSSGAYVVNDTILQMSNCHLPFGGVGASGYGRFHGKDGFIGFSNPKSIAKISSLDKFPTDQRYPPYTDSKKSIMKKLLKFGSVTTGSIGRFLLLVAILVAVGFVACKYLPQCNKSSIDL